MPEPTAAGGMIPALRSRRATTVALAVVLVLIATLAVVSAFVGRSKASDVATMVRTADAFGAARAASLTAHHHADRYPRAPTVETRAAFEIASSDVALALDLARRTHSDDVPDLEIIDRALALNTRYAALAEDFFAAVDVPDPPRAGALASDVLEPTYESLEAILAELDRIHRAEAEPRLAALEQISTLFAVGTPAGLIGALAILLLVWRERGRAEALERRELAASAADRTRSAVLATMSHELRTPLNAILGFSQLLLEGAGLRERDRVYVQNVHRAGQSLLHVVNDVLAITNADASPAQLRLTVIALSSLLEPVVAYGRERATARGLAFELRLPSDAHVLADVGSVRVLLRNLLSNAVKFTQVGQVTLAARVDAEALLLEVSDTGVGIRPEDRARIFAPFERIAADDDMAQGPGLGLALVRRLVELQGGTIGIESVAGAGTTFSVRLPSVVILARDGARLLVVEDDQGDAGLVSALAWEHGLFVEVATTVASALAAIARERPLGVVLDLRLPDGRGEQVLAALRAESIRIPVVVVTVEDPMTPLLDVDGFITKPLDAPRLRAWLARTAGASREAHANTPR